MNYIIEFRTKLRASTRSEEIEGKRAALDRARAMVRRGVRNQAFARIRTADNPTPCARYLNVGGEAVSIRR